ncbi:aminoglycoside phosphotransferase family protein [Paenibacillus sp. GCM10027626]|uniref:aminoglycoside phosphotransferase family protein n=1 Tax=Paenibacillus sp. GCM10027626 TaxID=3273411 RepID=UPI003634CFDF
MLIIEKGLKRLVNLRGDLVMSTRHGFNPNEKAKIIERFGNDFYEKVLRDFDVYAEMWNLTSLQFIPSYSANIVFVCQSANFGDAVLKIGNPSSREIRTEFNTLRQYNGRRFCKVFAADLENGVILEARVQPGTPLREENSLESRAAVFCSLYKYLHEAPENEAIYPTYIEWVERITAYMSKRIDCQELYRHMSRAKEICLSIASKYSEKMLLHGDFHHDNILLGPGNAYVIIDPKGVIGDPVFDIPRFILNEFDDEITPELEQKINDLICILGENLDIPSGILKQCLYVETVMGMCWMVEDGAPPEQYPQLMKQVAFVEALMGIEE